MATHREHPPGARGFVNLELNLLVASGAFLLAALVGALLSGLGAETFGSGFVTGLFSGWRLTSLILGTLGLALLFGPELLDALKKPFRTGPTGTDEGGREG